MATTEIQEALAAFTFFPELPTELQLTIWEYAIPAPRGIPIEVFGYKRSPDILGLFGHYERDRFRTKVQPSGLLGACKLSRETILKRYNVCIESGSRKIRLDGMNDIVLLYSKPSKRMVMPRLLPWLWTQAGKDKRYDYVRKFEGIKQIAFDPFQRLFWGPMVEAYIVSHFESLEIRHLIGITDIKVKRRFSREQFRRWIDLMDRPILEWEMGTSFQYVTE
jgi:hypothetical protein